MSDNIVAETVTLKVDSTPCSKGGSPCARRFASTLPDVRPGVLLLPVVESTGPTTCPPHHWFIEAHHSPQGSTESWTCLRCKFARTVERQREQAVPRRLFSVGSSGRAAAAPVAERDGAIAAPAAATTESPVQAANELEGVIVRK